MAYIPASNSVVAFQSQPSSLLVGASIIGLTPVNVVNLPSPSIIAYQVAGSVMAVSGSFTANPQNSIIAIQAGGSVMAVNMPSPSVVAYQLAGSVMAISGTLSSTPQGSIIAIQLANSVMGIRTDSASVIMTQGAGTWITSVVNTVPSSMLVGASVIGTVPVTQTTSPWVVNMPSPSVIATQIAGSVMAVSATQGTSPWVVNFPSPSVIANQVGGSVLAVNMPSPSVLAIQPAGSVMAVNMPSPSILLGSSNGSVITFIPTTTTSVYAVLSSITTVSIMAVNTARIGATIFNAAGTTAYIKLGVAVTTSVYTVALNPSDYYELPFGYTGVVAGITASNAGIINITEIQR